MTFSLSTHTEKSLDSAERIEELLIFGQLEEWAAIEEDAEALEEVIIDDWEMNDEMDAWQDLRDQKEELLATQARSPLPPGPYLIPKPDGANYSGTVWGCTGRHPGGSPSGLSDGWEDRSESYANITNSQTTSFVHGYPGINNSPFYNTLWLPETRPLIVPPGIFKTAKQLISGDKMLVEVKVSKKGTNFISGTSSKGGVYIDLKYTSYVPKIGENVWMIVRVKEADRSFPLQCVNIPKQ
jgi:hypothetical protein